MRFSAVRRERGQILVMTTLSVIALFGILALAVDVGWAYYLRKSAQKAADAASMAAAIQVLANVGNATISCSGNVTCQGATACPSTLTTPSTSEITVACLYAQQNGFTQGGNNGSQNVNSRFRHDDSSAHGSRRQQRFLLGHGSGDADHTALVRQSGSRCDQRARDHQRSRICSIGL